MKRLVLSLLLPCLAVGDARKSGKCMCVSLDTVREIGKLLEQNSLQRNTRLDEIRAKIVNELSQAEFMCFA